MFKMKAIWDLLYSRMQMSLCFWDCFERYNSEMKRWKKACERTLKIAGGNNKGDEAPVKRSIQTIV